MTSLDLKVPIVPEEEMNSLKETTDRSAMPEQLAHEPSPADLFTLSVHEVERPFMNESR